MRTRLLPITYCKRGSICISALLLGIRASSWYFPAYLLMWTTYLLPANPRNSCYPLLLLLLPLLLLYLSCLLFLFPHLLLLLLLESRARLFYFHMILFSHNMFRCWLCRLIKIIRNILYWNLRDLTELFRRNADFFLPPKFYQVLVTCIKNSAE